MLDWLLLTEKGAGPTCTYDYIASTGIWGTFLEEKKC